MSPHRPAPRRARPSFRLEQLDARDTPTFLTLPPDTLPCAGLWNLGARRGGLQRRRPGRPGGRLPALRHAPVGRRRHPHRQRLAGTFTTGQVLPISSGDFPEAAVAFDANNDGKLDLAVALVPTSSTLVFLGNGDGTFQVPRRSTTRTGPGPSPPRTSTGTATRTWSPPPTWGLPRLPRGRHRQLRRRPAAARRADRDPAGDRRLRRGRARRLRRDHRRRLQRASRAPSTGTGPATSPGSTRR